MTKTSATTESLCPHCLQRIPAQRIVENENVYLTKTCPEHGEIPKVLIWKNNRLPLEKWHRRHRIDQSSNEDTPRNLAFKECIDSDKPATGCPFECGICRNHKQHTCSVIVEVVNQCNLQCPICFSNSQEKPGRVPTLSQIEAMLQKILDSAGACPIQISGGEPSLRNDLPQIIARARQLGFEHIQVNTNGIRLAQDLDFLKSLKESGITDFFLQFDGLTDNIYQQLRGASLLSIKLRAIEVCAEMKMALILVPTIVKGVNDHQIGSIIQFAKKWMPAVKGVHFQPMTYLGRYSDSPQNEKRMLIPDILSAIEEQTTREFTIENFIPPG
jgi:7,8-dihydro-6-hydroxymethylpterin dimethyltransferase